MRNNVTGTKQPMLFLPPPPEHPPPSDMGTPPDSPTPLRYGPPALAGFPQSRSPLSSDHATGRTGGPSGVFARQKNYYPEHSGSDRSSSFSPRSQQQYADGNAYPQMAPSSGVIGHPPQSSQGAASPRSYHNPRTYSPHGISDPEYGGLGGRPVVRPGYEGMVPPTVLCRPFSDTEGVALVPHRGLNRSPPSPAPGDPMTDRAIQSSLPSLASECITPLPRSGLFSHLHTYCCQFCNYLYVIL